MTVFVLIDIDNSSVKKKVLEIFFCVFSDKILEYQELLS